MSAGSDQPGSLPVAAGEADGETLYAEAPAEEARPASLIDSIVDATSGTAARSDARPDLHGAANRLDLFLGEPSPGKALRLWFGAKFRREAFSKDELARALNRHIGQLDGLLSDQVNAIIHHPRFQRLEASWRGLHYLVEQAGGADDIKIRVLNVTWKELGRDAERAIEFDQSQLFRKVYSSEFGMPGGEPFSVLLGDYEIHPFPSAEHRMDDLATLKAVSQVAAAAFAPFVGAVHPSMFGLKDFSGLEKPLNLPRMFQQLEYLKWRAFRDTEDSRFVGLAMPRVLMRRPYEDDCSRVDGFRFREETSGPDRSKYLWGNAAFAFGAVLVRAFAESGWLADIRGVERGIEGGGLVTGLPLHCFSTDKEGVAPKCSTDVIVTDRQEPELSELGFVPLCHCKDTGYSAFYANQSLQKPKRYDDEIATTNAKISSMLQYMLCVSRIAHYLKVIARDKIGAFSEAEEVEDYLHRWLQNYVTADGEAEAYIKAKYPLREARIRVRPHPENPGSYVCVAHLWPHFQLDELVAALRVKTELIPARE